jgi:hypothetical protein
MFEFMILQCIAIAVVMFVPQISTYLPHKLQMESRATTTEEVDDSMNKLEEEYKSGQEPDQQNDPDNLEKDELSNPPTK